MRPFLEHYPLLAELPDLSHILNSPRILPAHSTVFREGEQCHGFPLVLRGHIRVFKRAENGRELELYRIHAGESCIVSISCLIQHTPYHARAITEDETELCVLPEKNFQHALELATFRNHILQVYSSRVTDLIELIAEIAFQTLDVRLAERLLGHGAVLHTTHAQLANELGCAREIVSRILKQFEQENLIQLGRGSIQIINTRGLRLHTEKAKNT